MWPSKETLKNLTVKERKRGKKGRRKCPNYSRPQTLGIKKKKERERENPQSNVL